MEELDKIRIIFRLKEIYRATPVMDRKESSAEHSWACMVLADYFLTSVNFNVEGNRVRDLLLYHDMVEIETGDVFFTDMEGRKGKEEREAIGAKELMSKMPSGFAKRYENLHIEYIERKTNEAKFAHAIDKIEPLIHSLIYDTCWKEWGLSEQQILDSKMKHVGHSEIFINVLNSLLAELKKKDYITYTK